MPKYLTVDLIEIFSMEPLFKSMSHFETFSFIPEAQEKLYIKSRAFDACDSSFRNNVVSSANCEILISHPKTEIPSNSWFWTILRDNISVTNKNKKGEMGSPA